MTTYPPPRPTEPDPDILRRGAVLLPGETNEPEGETYWQRLLRMTADRRALASWNEAVQGWRQNDAPTETP